MDYSIVATTYNDEDEIESYLSNIANQSLQPVEIIIADGGSTDHTKELINTFSSTSIIPIILLENGRMNIAEGYNYAIKAAKSKLIGITGIGNCYDRHFFEALYDGLDGCDGTYSPIRGLNRNVFSKLYNYSFLCGDEGERMSIPSNHGALIHKDVFDKLNYFYEGFVYAGEDTELYLRAIRNGYRFHLIPDATLKWKTPTSMKEFLHQTEVYEIADMQIDRKQACTNFRWNAIKSVFVIVTVIICFVFALNNDGIINRSILFLLLLLILLRWKWYSPFRFLRTFLRGVYFVKHKKYLNMQFAVIRQMI